MKIKIYLIFLNSLIPILGIISYIIAFAIGYEYGADFIKMEIWQRITGK